MSIICDKKCPKCGGEMINCIFELFCVKCDYSEVVG